MGSDRKIRQYNMFQFKERWKKIREVSYDDVVRYLYSPTDPSSLGVVRFLFGLLMLVDLPEERGGSDIDIRWGDPRDCHFPLFPVLTNPGFPCMCMLYCTMWFGACGIMLGYKFRWSVFLFGVPYWYILLLDKSYWNNHSYLFGLVTILLMGSSANHFLSLDGYLDESKKNKHVPYWNYFILKYQFFLLYFLAGLKKIDMEWLEGYSMKDIGGHWVFIPFQYVLSSDKIDYLVVHWFGFLLDLTIGFWMMVEFTRPVAMLFCACFHLMNSRLFSIGMFPYVCLATMPLFCVETWPRRIQSLFTRSNTDPSPSSDCIYSDDKTNQHKGQSLENNVKWKHRFVAALLICHCGLQLFLPYSHFITKGYNNWTKGLYGYSWDMMVHSWDTILVVVKVVDNDSGREHFVDAGAWTQNDRWNKHADMCVQYAHCLKGNLLEDKKHESVSSLQPKDMPNYITSDNISIYVDVWCSLNKRFQQRMYDPNYDLLKANWSPYEPVEWLMPVLAEYSGFRTTMNDISKEVYSWSNNSDVLFIADFPGMYLENFINSDLQNVTLTVLEGKVVFEMEDQETLQSIGVPLKKGDRVPVEVGVFHKIHTVGESPSCYMYTFVRDGVLDQEETDQKYTMYSPFPLVEDVQDRMESLLRMWRHIGSSFLYVLLGRPYQLRSKK
ncbi:vitamin K-dependent gamma-carboxylase [Anoplophora glabripennis]|uniref:vitamin K-dependent gamma-carboxylase n=1 Tax=Anoplophora glabripennis TaxID=217634 RepID=UPI000875008A|nr:vitamin K-dependent gamma-carboxylase [Anoplophora glabripennis]XP_018566322.1 vitamin K-dependent gamma-carboxylase [Anoplophora glabripennis]